MRPWETVSRWQPTSVGSMIARFQSPSDGGCATLDGDRRDIADLLVNARDAETAEVFFAASYPGAAGRVRCAARITVRGGANIMDGRTR